jgi:hypothetical protein
MALAPEREGRTVAADILNAHGAEFVGFYGRWAWQGFTRPQRSGRRRRRPRRARNAGRPDDMPRLFVRP